MEKAEVIRHLQGQIEQCERRKQDILNDSTLTHKELRLAAMINRINILRDSLTELGLPTLRDYL